MLEPKSKIAVLFIDGECVFCNRIVLWVLTIKRLDHIKFSTIQGQYFQQVIKITGVEEIPDSVVFYHEGQLLYKSEAAFTMIRELGKFQSILISICSIIPLFIRNMFYDIIAKNRYQWYGKTSAFCNLPPDKLKERTITDT